MQRDPATYDPRNTLMDESKQADVENLGDCLRALGEGQSTGEFSPTVVLYGHAGHGGRQSLPQEICSESGTRTADGAATLGLIPEQPMPLCLGERVFYETVSGQ